MLLLGHRGARCYAPENTLAAFELALEHGCDGFEFDVRLTADRRCVICHDPRIGRLEVHKCGYQELPPGTACLPDVLERFAGRAFLDIELKVSGLEEDVAAMLRDHAPRRGFYVSSFLPEVVQRMHACDSNLPLGLICDSRCQVVPWNKLPIRALFLHHRLVTPSTVEALRSAGKEVFVWTVNGEREMRQLAGFGLAGIISDDTKLLGETLRNFTLGSKNI